jgi:hypothetical protein
MRPGFRSDSAGPIRQFALVAVKKNEYESSARPKNASRPGFTGIRARSRQSACWKLVQQGEVKLHIMPGHMQLFGNSCDKKITESDDLTTCIVRIQAA